MSRREIVAAFMVTRIALVAVGLAALAWLPSLPGYHVSSNPLIDMWYRWDSGFYTSIGLNGYSWQRGAPDLDTTFLPLYPALVGLPFHGWADVPLAVVTAWAALLSNACLLAALFYFDALLALDAFDARTRRLALWLLLLAPATVFFSSAYTESLYILLAFMALYYARRRRWTLAGLAGLLAGMTRVVGWVLVLPLAWEAWEQFRRGETYWRLRGRLAARAGTEPGRVAPARRISLAADLAAVARGFAPALAPGVGLGLYVGAVGLALHAPRAYFWITASRWYQGFSPPWLAFSYYFTGPVALHNTGRSLLDLAVTLLFFTLAVCSLRLRVDYALYALAAVLFPVLSGTLVSMPRYVAVAFPAYVLLARWCVGHVWRTAAVVALSGALAAGAAAGFGTWHWIA